MTSSTSTAEADDFDLAVAHHQAGRLAQAKAIYQRMLQAEPDAPDILYMLAAVAFQEGDIDTAGSHLERVLNAEPNNPEALYLAGMVAYQQARYKVASQLMGQALQLQTGDAGAHYTLGNALMMQGRNDEAVLSYRRALELDPNYADAHLHLGQTLAALGLHSEAIASLDRSLSLAPGNPEAYFHLGNALAASGDRDRAATSYRQVLALVPDHAATHNNLGNLLMEQGLAAEAEPSFRQALALQPDDPEIHCNLAGALKALSRRPEATECYRRAVALQPDYVRALGELGADLVVYERRFDEGVEYLDKAIRIQPDDSIANKALGLAYWFQGRVKASEERCKVGMQLRPNDPEAHSNYLLSLHYLPELSPADIFAAHRAYADRYESLWLGHQPQHPPPKAAGRLNIGLVSGDFRLHPVGVFLEGVLTHLDRQRFNVFLYSTGDEQDEVTERLRRMEVAWRPVRGVPDEVVARGIGIDGIDILVDLSGHTGHNRLPLFARKPAPLQVTWLGYWATTGLESIDYILSDQHSVRPEDGAVFSERPWLLPETRWCYTPPRYEMEVGRPPALATGNVTFGNFNHMAKVNDRVIALWARLLSALPGARLYLKTLQMREASVQRETLARFAAHGITADRLKLEGPTGHADYLAAYRRVDIALDPFPFNGGVTSVDGLWMGVPFVTLRGDRMVARQGESILQNVGLGNWIAEDEDDYVAKVLAFSADLLGLNVLRAELRGRLLASPLCDAAKFAGHLGEAFEGMWQAHAARAPE